jgi:deoxyribodipyrimidine photolyase-related protein
MSNIGIVFPHQLFEISDLIRQCDTIYLVEEWLFFRQYHFHKRKIAFHRATMKCYQSYLEQLGKKVLYVNAYEEASDIRRFIPELKKIGMDNVFYVETTDHWLEKRLISAANKTGITLTTFPSPLFLNTSEENRHYFSDKKRFFQTDFYIYQRKKRHILLEDFSKPTGGKWSFDDENRLKYPKGKVPPKINFGSANSYHEEAIEYTNKYFSGNYGNLNAYEWFPISFEESKKWFREFLKSRLAEFGDFEDAIVQNEKWLHHSILTPMLNIGLLTPSFLLDETLSYAADHHPPLNSLEGFIRQVVGWREFIRAVYEIKGTEERTKNFWGFKRKIPESFWRGETGILPIDMTIKKALETGYCHHIERLMVLGNFMLLCEFDPDEVYRWFMELFIDAFDWVMVPNVYGMSQFADGGIMSTKPYISGSNYLMKMSDFPKGAWQGIWDGLFWHFMDKQRAFFLKNPRLGMLVRTFDQMAEDKKQQHIQTAMNFLQGLSS